MGKNQQPGDPGIQQTACTRCFELPRAKIPRLLRRCRSTLPSPPFSPSVAPESPLSRNSRPSNSERRTAPPNAGNASVVVGVRAARPLPPPRLDGQSWFTDPYLAPSSVASRCRERADVCEKKIEVQNLWDLQNLFDFYKIESFSSEKSRLNSTIGHKFSERSILCKLYHPA